MPRPPSPEPPDRMEFSVIHLFLTKSLQKFFEIFEVLTFVKFTFPISTKPLQNSSVFYFEDWYGPSISIFQPY